MKEWSKDSTELVEYCDLISPLKKIIHQGYKLYRQEKDSFLYDGYDIGEKDKENHPPPDWWFGKKCLEWEKSRGRTLLDVVMNVAFLLGMEQGRRAEKKSQNQINDYLLILEKLKEENKNLRLKLDAFEAINQFLQDKPNSNINDFVNDFLNKRKSCRFEQAKKETKICNLNKIANQNDAKNRKKFCDLVLIAKNLNSNHCSTEQWEAFLKENGWTFEQWNKKCKKKFIRTQFNS